MSDKSCEANFGNYTHTPKQVRARRCAIELAEVTEVGQQRRAWLQAVNESPYALGFCQGDDREQQSNVEHTLQD